MIKACVFVCVVIIKMIKTRVCPKKDLKIHINTVNHQ